MKLVPFTRDDYPLIISWIPDEAFNLLWGGTLYHWPITIEQIAEHQKKKEVRSFILVHEDKKVGHIELYRISDDEYRLCRVIIAETLGRGRGYGKRLIRLAIAYAKQYLHAKTLSLSVFEQNENALNCYHSLGFQISSREEGTVIFNGEKWPFFRMNLSL